MTFTYQNVFYNNYVVGYFLKIDLVLHINDVTHKPHSILTSCVNRACKLCSLLLFIFLSCTHIITLIYGLDKEIVHDTGRIAQNVCGANTRTCMHTMTI